MLIVCPTCATSYQVEKSALGTAGRSVRCVRCRTVWLAGEPAAGATPAADDPATDAAVAAFKAELSDDLSPLKPAPADSAEPVSAAEIPAGEPEPQPAVAPDGAKPALDDLAASGTPDPTAPAAEAPPAEDAPPLSLSEITIPDAGAAPSEPDVPDGPDPVTLQQAREDIESAAARRRRAREARGSLRTQTLRHGLPALLLILVSAVTALIVWRTTIVRHLPQTASFYETIRLPVNVRGLEFAGVKLARDTHDGVPVLVVEGQIVSVSTKPVDVPRLRLALRNAASGEVYAWTTVPTQSTLEPGQTLAFRSRLAAPPEDARDVMVRFFSRRDTVAGLR